MPKKLICLKLGGSLITDKSVPFSFHEDVVRKVGLTIHDLILKYPDYGWILGNGAGSFGHYVAHQTDYQNHKSDSVIAAKVHDSVAKLNQKVVAKLCSAMLPAVSLQPSQFLTRKASSLHGRVERVKQMLVDNKIPVVYGDVIPDTNTGSSIATTEEILDFVSSSLDEYNSVFTIYLTIVDGVYDQNGKVIPQLKEDELGEHISGSAGFDVTGGMAQKVKLGFEALQHCERVLIINGNAPDKIEDILNGESVGTELVKI